MEQEFHGTQEYEWSVVLCFEVTPKDEMIPLLTAQLQPYSAAVGQESDGQLGITMASSNPTVSQAIGECITACLRSLAMVDLPWVRVTEVHAMPWEKFEALEFLDNAPAEQ